MKTSSRSAARKRVEGRLAKRIFTVAITLAAPHATAAVVDLGSAGNFAILAGTGITIAGPVNSTTITGDIGSHPNSSNITGLENLILNGTNHGGNNVTQQAKTDLSAAYLAATLHPADTSYGAGHVLVGTLAPGVYNSTSTFGIATGSVLTLDAAGDADAFWIFQAGSSLTTGSDSRIELINGASAANVFWQVGSSATLGTSTEFVGSILALESITLNTGATILDGRALALNGLVTMDNNTIAIPEPASALLLCSGLAIGLLRRRAPSRSPRSNPMDDGKS